MQEALFVTDVRYINYEIPGGVQRCTMEFISYMEMAGFHVVIKSIVPKVSLKSRIFIKLGIDAYNRYDFSADIDQIAKIINERNIRSVFFNQLNISVLATHLKNKVSSEVKFIGLSHGNESGDYLPHLARTENNSAISTWRLGKLLLHEYKLFSKILDGVIAISNQELQINQWLGADKLISLPRILKPELLKWNPVKDRIGFVGTMDHLPNYKGIDILAKSLSDIGFTGELRVAGGPINAVNELSSKYARIKPLGKLTESALCEEAATWTIFVNPVFWYARGSSTKVSQAINWGLPVISTPAGVRGYDLENKIFLTQDQDAQAFAKRIKDTLASEDRIKILREASLQNAAYFDSMLWAQKLRKFVEYIHS